MNKYIAVALLSASLAFSGLSSQSAQAGTRLVYVDSFPEGAPIIVDSQNSNKITPDYITLPAGATHNIKVQPAGTGWNNAETNMLIQNINGQTVFFTLTPVTTQGPQGDVGPQGIQGPQGGIGPQGIQGIPGNIGPQGIQGTQGSMGPQGFQGTQGGMGPQGFQGTQGGIGPQGFQGTQGDIGPQGIQGPQGIIGLQGIQGPQGIIGLQGIQGPQGIIGLQGIQGPQGDIGPQGTQGDIGPQGVQGADGSGDAAGSNYIKVIAAGTPQENAAELLTAYQNANLLVQLPTRTASNRVVVLVSPGQYDLGTGALNLTNEDIDVVGVSANKADQRIYGTTNGSGSGVVMQTASDVHLKNLTIESLGNSGTNPQGPTGQSAYFPNSNLPLTVVENCTFKSNYPNSWPMRGGITYSGRYTDCDGSDDSFGYGVNTNLSGTFTNCTGALHSFAFQGTASGTFTNCTSGDASFAFQGIASGTFTNCTGGATSYAYQGTASGKFTSCFGNGDNCFGTGGNAVGGKFYFCRSTGANSFNNAAPASTFFFNCERADTSFP